MNKERTIKRYESTASHYERKGKREWAYAKNGHGNEHYGYAKNSFSRAASFRDRADKLRNK